MLQVSIRPKRHSWQTLASTHNCNRKSSSICDNQYEAKYVHKWGRPKITTEMFFRLNSEEAGCIILSQQTIRFDSG